MTTPSEPTAEEREAELAALRKQMSRALRRGEQGEFDRLKAAYDAAKDAHVMASHAEAKAVMRARRAVERAEVASAGPVRWRLPAGFGTSPLAQQRAREGWRPRVEPVAPAGGLNPWRGGWHPASERVWRPPS